VEGVNFFSNITNLKLAKNEFQNFQFWGLARKRVSLFRYDLFIFRYDL